MEVRGDYTGEDGQQRQLRVPAEAPRHADPYQMLLAGMARMRELVNELLEASLHPMEASDSEDEASDGDDEDGAEAENNPGNPRANPEEPSAKRFKNST